MQLPLIGVLLHCLRQDQTPVLGASASGFIQKEADGLWLYTCWHVVTGFNPYDLRLGMALPERRYLQVSLQSVEQTHPDLQVVGGLQSLVLPLYRSSESTARPNWYQDAAHVPHLDLNSVGIFVPFWHDLVKLKLPDEVHPSDIQIAGGGHNPPVGFVAPGEKCVIVGFPYGFSSFGLEQPTAVALTRFVASSRIFGRRSQQLLESAAAPGMSGGPVFVERGDQLLFFGVYVGQIFPDYVVGKNERVTALGIIENLFLLLSATQALVELPTEAQSAES